MGKKIFLISSAAVLLAGASATGLILTSKKAKARRFFKRTGRTMYNVGSMLQALSCQEQMQ